MLITVEGLVIGQRTVGENGVFLDVFTDKLGMVEVMVHGAKKINSKSGSSASLFSYSKFCMSNNKNTYTLNSSEPIYNFYKISESIEGLSLAAYFAELIKYCTTSEENHRDLLRFASMTFYQIEKGSLPLDFIKAIFEFRFITHIGFMPDLRACKECICYEHEKMCFLPDDGILLCSDCLEENEEYSDKPKFLLSPTLLYTLRYVAYSDTEKMFRFKINEENMKIFSQIAEYYILNKLGRDFKTLDYYKNICIM